MRSGRVHPAWVVAAAGFVALVMAAGFRSTAGVLLVPLHDEFGWSHETIGLAVSLNLLCFGVGAPFAAALVEWVGMRRVVAAALATIAVSSVLTIGMTEPWQLFLLWGVVNGLATGAVSVPLAAIIANRWFQRRRGLVRGLLTRATPPDSSSSCRCSPGSPPSTGATQPGWWRSSPWCSCCPWSWRSCADRPMDVGVRPFGADASWREPEPTGPAFGAALDALGGATHSRTFWLLAATFFVCGATTNGLIQTHLIPAAHDHGITQVTACSP